MDITALVPGIYRLVAIADREGGFAESDDSNNRTWVKLLIRENRVEILGYGPAARSKS